MWKNHSGAAGLGLCLLVCAVLVVVDQGRREENGGIEVKDTHADYSQQSATYFKTRRMLLEMGTGLPVFTGLRTDRLSGGGGGNTVDRAALSSLSPRSHIDSTAGLPSYKDGSDGFPSFKDWIKNDPKLLKSPPSQFDLDTQENGPDSEPMHLSRLYTSPDANMIHSAAVAAAAGFEDGDTNA